MKKTAKSLQVGLSSSTVRESRMDIGQPGWVQGEDGGQVGKGEGSLRVNLPPVGEGDGGVDDDGGQPQSSGNVAPGQGKGSW